MPVHASFVDSLEDVANLAIGKIGEKRTLSNIETDVGVVAEKVRLFIYQVMREVQSEFRWGELTASVLLASPMAENDDTYQYTLPSDFLRPASNRDQEHVIENGYLFTGVSENFPFKYIRYSEDPAEWSGLLVKCIYFRLALEICMPLTENIQRYNGLLEEYEKLVFPRAQKVGSFDNENPRTRIARGRYSRTRGGMAGALVGAFNRVIGVIAPGHNHDTHYMPLHGENDISTVMLQAGSVTADKLSADAKALATDADVIVLHDAKDYADAQDIIAMAAAVSDAADASDAQDAILRAALIPNAIYAEKTGVQTITGSNSTPNWTDVTSLSVTITPRLASSKLRIRVVLYGYSATSNKPMILRVVRDDAAIVTGASPGNRISCHGILKYINGSNQPSESGCCAIELLVSATSTSATTFKVQAGILSATTDAGKINQSPTDTDSALFPRLISILSVEEVFKA